MEIESDESQLSKNISETYKTLQILVQKQSFSLKKASKIAQKHQNQLDVCQSLMNLCRQGKKIETRVNICRLLVEIWKFNSLARTFNVEFVEWIITQIYQIRWETDKLQTSESHISIKMFNQLIKLAKQLILKLKMSQDSSLLEDMNTRVYQFEKIKPFQSFNNIIFTLKMLSFLEHGDGKQHIGCQSEIADFYLAKLLQYTPQSIEAEQIIAVSILNSINKYQNLGFRMHHFLQQSTFHQKLVILQKCLPQGYCLQLLRLNECKSQQQFQLITQIVSCKYDMLHLRRQLCTFWLINCRNLLETDYSVDLSGYISTLGPQISAQILALTNNQLNEPHTNVNRENLLLIWSGFLLDAQLREHLSQQKSLFIGTQLIFYQFTRQIVGQLDNTLTSVQAEIILKTFRLYFPTFLQQKQCEALIQKLICYYVEYYPNYLTPYFLIKSKEKRSQYSPQITNLSIFDLGILQTLLQRANTAKQKLIDLLRILNSEVGVILVKYIVQKSQCEYNQFFGFEHIIGYLVQNNIEIHLDKFQYQLYKRISQNIEKFIKIIRKCSLKNRYEIFINSYILDLLQNELINEKGLKKLPSTFTTLIYIAQRHCDILSLAEQKGITVQNFICCLYAFANRSLFLNVPDAVYLLLSAIAQIKQTLPGVAFNIEEVVLHNLQKFLKQYEDHNTYYLLGLSSIMMIVYGLPSQTFKVQQPSYTYWQAISQLSLGTTKITNYLKSTASIEKIISRKEQQISSKICSQFSRIFLKIIVYNTLARINHLIMQNSLEHKIRNQVSSLRAFVCILLDLQIPRQSQSKSMEIEDQKETARKRLNSIDYYDEETFAKEENNSKIANKIELSPKPINNLEQLLGRLANYDQFKHFRHIQSLLKGVGSQINYQEGVPQHYSKLQRVDGKIRTILHVKK